MKQYRGIQETQREESPSSSEESEPAFVTSPPRPWAEFTTLMTNIRRRRGLNYVSERLKARTITPTVIRVQKKVSKSADRMILLGQLAKEHLMATKTKEKA
jgi:hypothetical protein